MCPRGTPSIPSFLWIASPVRNFVVPSVLSPARIASLTLTFFCNQGQNKAATVVLDEFEFSLSDFFIQFFLIRNRTGLWFSTVFFNVVLYFWIILIILFFLLNICFQFMHEIAFVFICTIQQRCYENCINWVVTYNKL